MGTAGVRTWIAVALALLTVLPATRAAHSQARGAAGWFRVSWALSPDGVGSRISGDVFNDSPYRVTNVRLEIEGLNGDSGSVGRASAWVFGDIRPGGRTFFAAEPIPGSISYRVTVVSWDVVSLGEAP